MTRLPVSISPRPAVVDGPQDLTTAKENPMPEPEPAQDAHEVDADTSTPAETEAEAEADQAAVPANRAARRAKGKKAASPQPHGKGQQLGGRGSVQSPRLWGNRRSG
ncbi:hypothetical protein AB0C06_16045 [Micromonospora inaquosa]|uniref:hypothetical protein n=1 Tax=Micromonospora inaquosa TaxID=2203716 RepID=UPI0033DFCAB6